MCQAKWQQRENTQCYRLRLYNFSLTGKSSWEFNFMPLVERITLHLINQGTYSFCLLTLTPAFISFIYPFFPRPGRPRICMCSEKAEHGNKNNSFDIIKWDDIKAIRSIRNNRYKLMTKELMLWVMWITAQEKTCASKKTLSLFQEISRLRFSLHSACCSDIPDSLFANSRVFICQ